MTASTPITFRRATRAAVKLKVGIDGPAGSGKTEGMLALLRGITSGGRIAVADSENESASFYADRYQFDGISLDARSTPQSVIQIIDAAVEANYDALGIDSLSRVWQNILAAKDAYDLANPAANRWTTWGLPQFGGGWEKMMKHLLDAPIHIVATMRSKMAHEQIEQDGRKKVIKLGLQAQVRDGAEYEFGLVFSVNMAHRAEATKDRTHLFEVGEMLDLCDGALHKRLVQWMNTETPASAEALSALVALSKRDGVSETARKEVLKLVATGTPGADRVARYAERLEKLLAGEAKANGNGASAPAPTLTPITAETPWELEDGIKGQTVKQMSDKALLWILSPSGNSVPRAEEWRVVAKAEVQGRGRVPVEVAS